MSQKTITIRGEEHEILVKRDGRRYSDGVREIEVVALYQNEAEIRVDGRNHRVPFLAEGPQVSFVYEGTIYAAEIAEAGRTRTRSRHHTTAAPMPGVVLKILVSVGDVVRRGAPLLILEAMKMEHPVAAPHDGTVAAILCQPGELVQPGVDLVDVTEESGS